MIQIKTKQRRSNKEIVMILKIIGGGLAGCEAAWQAAERGIKVKLYEMKPGVFSPAHTNENLCELVCSNSLKAMTFSFVIQTSTPTEPTFVIFSRQYFLTLSATKA